MRKLAPALVSYRHDFLISYRVYMMTGLFHIALFEGTLHAFSSPEPVVSWSRGRETRGSGRSRYRMSENFGHPVAHV